ncbi:hypothetical protein [Marinobacterium arenosum]|uniref:hypothetical protein n=1 Tax=Marinobacterium arenosum TaxID=2862496 RepID=UPI001C9510AC|nr:hypothetical protein [Marinobacterium arenosum]MBY4678786.1 hypothetical protein [Marinobacterium arenosum]
MFIALIYKTMLTALVVILVAKGVERLGPRFGGIVAGAPVVLGPAYFFLLAEHNSVFISEAVLSSMNAMTATLAFTAIYLKLSTILRLHLTLLFSTLGWLVSASILVHFIDSVTVSTIIFFVAYAGSKASSARFKSMPAPGSTQASDLDILVRALAAGTLVGIATVLAQHTGPAISGAISGFPIGFTVLILTLQSRHGVQVTQHTVSSAQTGMLSIFCFLLVLAHYHERASIEVIFWVAIMVSLLITSVFLLLSRVTAKAQL